MEKSKILIKHLVVDSGAFIKNAKLEEIGENIYTLGDIIREIRDKATKDRLQVLPYTLQFREPSGDDIRIVSDFSKKTGDYPTLSATDIRVLALTYLLQKEKVGIENLRTEPISKEVVIPKSFVPELSKSVVGFYCPKTDKVSSESEQLEEKPELALQNLTLDEDLKKPEGDDTGNESTKNGEDADEDGDEDDDEDEEEEDDDDDTWITLNNVAEAKKKMGFFETKPENTEVACLTTDFAMQNVLIQLGLPVVSMDGYLIRQAKTFILRCYACFKTTSNMNKQFCPNCGNKTLKRVPVTINEDGTKTVHLNFRRPLNIRGTRYSLPMPKGGKHSCNPILCEDQPIPHNRPSKQAQTGIDMFDPAYEVRSSPFVIKDIYTRAGLLGNRHQSQNGGHRPRNPNATGKNTGNRKHKK